MVTATFGSVQNLRSNNDAESQLLAGPQWQSPTRRLAATVTSRNNPGQSQTEGPYYAWIQLRVRFVTVSEPGPGRRGGRRRPRLRSD
jgi:hypothetical protein